MAKKPGKPGKPGGGGGNKGGGGGKKKKGKQPFNPTDPIKNKRQFRKILKRRTRGVIQPQLQALRQQRGMETATSQGRQRDIEGMYGYYDQQLRDAFDATSGALNELYATRAAGSDVAQQNILAAMNASRAADRSQASTIGGTLPSSENQGNALLSVFGSNQAAQGAMGQQFAAQEGLSAGRMGTAGLERVRASETENERFRAIIEDLARQKLGIKLSKPQIKEQMRTQLIQEELQKQAQRFQQRIGRQQMGLAKKEFGLSKRSFKEQKRAQRFQEKLAWQQLGLSRKQLKEQHWEFLMNWKLDKKSVNQQGKSIRADLISAGASAKEAKQGVNRWKSANDWLDGYVRSTKPNHYDFRQIMNNLTSRFKLTKKGALRVMKNGPKPMRQWADKHGGSGGGSTGLVDFPAFHGH